MDVSETAHLRGIVLACEEINAKGGIDGHPLSPIIADHKGDDRMFAEMATELLLRNSVNVIFGCCLSSSRKVVLQVVQRFNAVLFYPSVYEGFKYSPNVIYGGAVPNQLVVPLLEYLCTRHGRRIALVGSDPLYLAVSPYFSSIDTPGNAAFTDLYRRFHKTGSPGVYAQVAYALVHLYANALRTAGRGDTDSLLAALSGAVYNAPGGDLSIDAETNHVSVRPLIGTADAEGQYTVVWRSPMVIHADPYLIAYARSVGAMSV